MIALWDLGNVVVQWNPPKILQMLELPVEKKTCLQQSLFESRLWLDLDQGLTDEPAVAAKLASETVLKESDVMHCFDTVRESLTDFTASVELIGEMKAAGIPLYVLSNMSVVNANYLRARAYFDLFDGIVISAEEKLIKPDTELFKRVLDRFSLPASDTVFIDDSLPNIEAARSLGMQGVHFKATEQCYAAVRQYFPELE